MVDHVWIGDRRVDRHSPCFIIAEAGVNHDGRADRAHQLVDAAKIAGADAVKFQTFSAEALATADAPKADYQKQGAPDGQSQLDMLRALELSAPLHRELVDHCLTIGLPFLSTPFDEASATFLAELGVPAFKIGSGELTNLGLLTHVARLGRPMLLSTGMARLSEVEAAVDAVESTGNHEVILLQCVSNYPADPSHANLRAMQTMAAAFGVPVGYSDHTEGSDVALAAVALGASVLEKHFTLDRSLPGPDHRASIEPDELGALVRSVRRVESALGDGRKRPVDAERGTAAVARRSLVAGVDIEAGAVIRATDLVVRRPGTGLPPNLQSLIVGRVARSRIARGTLIQLEMLT